MLLLQKGGVIGLRLPCQTLVVSFKAATVLHVSKPTHSTVWGGGLQEKRQVWLYGCGAKHIAGI